jgi:UDP-N-acetylmuramate--alanine ligase
MFLGKTKRIHFIGIGGSGMSGIAEVLINLGYQVSGSDQAASRITERLENIGAKISYSHIGENAREAHVVVISSAINSNNPELILAKDEMIPVIPRAEMLAELMRMKYGIAVAGTHGKTTTTSLIATVLGAGKLDPTVVNGGKIKSIDSNAKLGQSQFLVAEADESDGSFLKLSPSLAVVTTLDEEHLDHYKTFEALKEAFLTFMNRIPFYGAAIICLDEPHIRSLIPRLEKRYITYGLNSQADYHAKNIRTNGPSTTFDVWIQNEKKLGEITSNLPGEHNIRNALAAIATGIELDLDFETAREAIKEFSGVQRRFEILGKSDSLILVDDYGHHPAEILATLKATREAWPEKRILVIFQPHRYSRTANLMEHFWSAFHDADFLIVTDIYPAGESPIQGVDSSRIAEGVKNYGHKKVEYIDSFENIASYLENVIELGDVLVTLGAGNIGEFSRRLASKLFTLSDQPG